MHFYVPLDSMDITLVALPADIYASLDITLVGIPADNYVPLDGMDITVVEL